MKRLIFFVFILMLYIVLPTIVFADIVSLQKGSFSMASGVLTDDITVDAVNWSNSWVIASYGVGTQQRGGQTAHYYNTSNTNLRFERFATANNVMSGNWYIVEFNSSMKKQQFNGVTGGTQTIAINEVIVNNTFPFLQVANTGGNWNQDDETASELRDTTTVKLHEAHANNLRWRLEVLEYPHIFVNHTTVDLKTLTSTTVDLGRDFDLDKSFLLYSWNITYTAGNDDYPYCFFNSTRTIGCEKITSGGKSELSLQAIEFADKTIVISSNISFGSTELALNVTIPEVHYDNSIAFATKLGYGGISSYTTNQPAPMYYRLNLTSSTNLYIERQEHQSSIGKVTYVVIDFGGAIELPSAQDNNLTVQFNLFLNNTEQNITLLEGQKFLVHYLANVSDIFDLTRNGTTIANNSEQNLLEGVYNFTITTNGTVANFTNVTHFATVVADNINPVINGTFNKSILDIKRFDVINATFNLTDDRNSINCTIVINQTGINEFFNFTFVDYVTGNTQECSRTFTINSEIGAVINITGIARDNSSNLNQNGTVFEVVEIFKAVDHFDFKIGTVTIDSADFVVIFNGTLNLTADEHITFKGSALVVKITGPQTSTVSGRLIVNNEILLSGSLVGTTDIISVNIPIVDADLVQGQNNITFEVSEDGFGAVNITNLIIEADTDMTNAGHEISHSHNNLTVTFSSTTFINIFNISINKSFNSSTLVDIQHRFEQESVGDTTPSCYAINNNTNEQTPTYARFLEKTGESGSSGIGYRSQTKTRGENIWEIFCKSNNADTISIRISAYLLDMQDFNKNTINGFQNETKKVISLSAGETNILNSTNYEFKNTTGVGTIVTIIIQSTSGSQQETDAPNF